jgi:hypothetical protein
MATTEDLQTRITTLDDEVLFVDKYDDDQLWISIQVRNGGARCVIGREEALKMLDAIKRVLEVE